MKVRVNWRGNEIKHTLAKATPTGLFKAGEEILGESVNQVPLREATLQDSGTVDVDETSQTVTISYDTPYAVRWHENDANFQHGRKKKYLEDPINDKDVQARVLRVLAEHTREAFK